MSRIWESIGRGNAKGIVGSIIAAVILAGIFIQPLNSAAFNINFTPVDPASISQPLQTNAPPLDFNLGIQLNPAEQLIVQEVQAVIDGQSSSPLRFQDNGAPIGSPDPRISLQQGSNFPPKGAVSMGGGYGYSYSYSYSYSAVSGQGFVGPITLPYILKVFPNQLPAGPHSVLVQIQDGTGAVTPSGVINFSIGGNFGSNPALGGQVSPPSVFVPPSSGSFPVTITLNSINNLHGSSPTIQLEANPFPGSQIAFSGTGVTGNTVVLNAPTKTVTMTITTTNVIPGQYNIFFKARVQGQSIEFPVNIPVSVVASNTPTLILNPQTVNPGSSLNFDGFNFAPGNTVTLSVMVPGVGSQPITISQYTVGQGSNNAQVAGDGRIQGTALVPSSAPAGTYPVTLTASPSGQTAQASLSIFAAGTSDFQLDVSPQVLNLPPPPPPGQVQDPNTLPSMEVSFSKIGSFNSAVTIQVQGLPPGVSTTFDSNNDNTYSPSENTIQPPSVGTESQPLRVKFISTSSTPFGFFPVSIQGSASSTFKFVQAQISIPPPQSFQGSGSSGIGVFSLNPPAGSTGTTVSFNGIAPSSLAGKAVAIRIAEDATNLATTTVGSGGTFSGSFTVPSNFVTFSGPVSSPSGNFPIKAIITDGPTLFADFNILSANASFRAEISPRDLPPVQAGSDSNTLTISASSLPGKAGGTVNVTVRGLPPNMTVKFDGGAFSSTTTSTMNLPAGGTVSKSIQFRAASNTPPGPIPLFIEVSSGSEVYGFPLPFGVMPNSSFATTFGFANVFLSKQTGKAGDDVTVTASGFQANSALTIIFGGLPTDPSFTATADSSGSATVPIKVPSTLQSGTYPVRVRDAVNKEAGQPFTIAGSSDTFSLSVSPSFLPPIEQGANPSPNTATVTVSVFSGKSLPANPVVSIKGLPPGVQAKFDSDAFSSTPTKTLTGISSGGTASTVISFKASDFAPPGPMNAFVEVVAGAERRGQPLNSGIMPKANFLSFGPGAGGFNAFDVGTVFLTPNSVSPGDAVTVTASGFTPNATPIIEVLTFPTPTLINLPGGTTFDSSGTFSGQVKIPSSLSSGQYEFEVREQGATRFANTRLTVVGSNDVFSLNVSPQFLPPAPQGGQSEPIQITASALSGKNAGTVTLAISGLPKGVTSRFDGTAASQTTLSLGTGGSASSQLVFSVDSKTPPGPVNLVLKATTSAAGSQTTIIPIDFGVRPDVAFINFGAGLAPGAFNPFSFGSLILNPNSGAAGDSLTISASGFTPNAAISSLNFGGTSISLPVGTTFDSSGSFTQSVKVPTLSAGFYPVSISDANGRNAVADFRVVSASATMNLKVSPEFIPPAPQGQTLGQSDETTITISALAGKTPGAVTLNLRGLPPGVTSHFNTGGGYSSTGSPSATVTVGAGASAEVKLKFVVSQNTPPGPIPLFLEATTSSETLGTPLPFGIRPSNAFVSLFGVGNVQLSPVVGTTSDTVTITASGFTANSAVTIVFGGNPGTDTISLPVGTTFDSTGFFSTTIKVPNLGPGMYPVTVSDASGRRDIKPFNVVGGSANFDVNVTPQFFPPIVQGQSSSSATVTISSLPGKNAGAVTLTVLGLPPGVTVAFDGVTSSGTPPTKTLTVGTGASSSTSMTLNVAQSTPPGGPYFTTLQVSDGATTRMVNLGFGVIPGGALTNNFGRLFVSPLAGQVNEPVTISATGFTPSSAVSLTFGTSTINVGGATFDSDGSFSTTIKVPSSLNSGFYPVKVSDATGRSDVRMFNVVGGSQNFQLSASPQFLPPVLQGDTSNAIVATVSSVAGKDSPAVTLRVQGLAPGMSLTFDGVAAASKILDPSTGESLSTSIKIVTSAATAPRPYPLQLLATTTSGETRSIPLGFGVMPKIGTNQGFASLSINPSMVAPGDTITLTGSGFAASTTFSTISVAVPGQPTPLSISIGTTITVGSDGTWNTEIKLPSSVNPGFYRLMVSSGSGANLRTAEAPLNVIPSSSGFFDVGLSPDFVSVVQGGAGTTTTMTVQSSNAFANALNLRVSGLPPGMTLEMRDSAGAIIATFTGKPTGTTVTGTPTVTPEAGGATSISLTATASSTVPTGPYMVFVGADQTGTGASRGEPLAIQVISSTGSSIVLSPMASPAGSKVTVTGAGFTGSETITLTFGGVSAGTSGFEVVPSTVTATSGSFSAQITVPTLNAGVYAVKAVANTSGKTATSQFQLMPASSTGDVILQVKPKQLTLARSSTGTMTLTLTPVGSLSSSVTLAASVPSSTTGVTATFLPASTVTMTPGIPTPVTLTIATTSGATLGNIPVTITATSGSSTLATESALLRVVSSGGDFTVSAAPKDVVVPRGASATSSVQIIAVGIAQGTTPTFSVTGLPSGVTGSVSGISAVDANGIATGTLTLSASSSAALGTTPLTLSGTISSTTRTTPLSVSVLSGAPSTFDVPTFDPTALTNDTPLNLNLQFNSTYVPTLNIKSLTTTTSNAGTIIPTLVNSNPTNLGTIPSGTTAVGTGVLNLEPTSPTTGTSFDLCIPLPSTLPSGVTSSNVRVAFLNTTQSTPTWTSLTTTIVGNLACAASDHFSSWSLVGSTLQTNTNISTGSNVQASFTTLGGGNILVKFDNVNSAGSVVIQQPTATALKTATPSIFSAVGPTTSIFTVGSSTANTVGTIFDVDISAIGFTGSIDVTIPYDPAQLPSGVSESSVKFFHWTGTSWQDNTLSVDTTNNTVTGRVTSLSPVVAGFVPSAPSATVTLGGGGGGGGGGSSSGSSSGGSGSVDLTTTYSEGYFLTNPLAKVQLQSTSFVNSATGLTVFQAKAGQQVTIASSFKNYQQSAQEYAIIIQVIDSNGYTTDLGWVTGKLQSGETAQASRSWTTEESGSYAIKMFVWNGVSGAPTPLSEVTTKTFTVT